MAAVAVSISAVFAGVPVSGADPYDDDDGGSSHSDDGGGADESDSTPDEPAGGGMEEPDEPAGGGMAEPDEPAGGGMEESQEPGGGGMAGDEPGGGGMAGDEPGGGGMAGDEPGGGGMAGDEPGGGGMATDPTPGGGGMAGDEPGGGGMATDPTPRGGGMAEPNEPGGGMAEAPSQDVSTAKKAEAVTATTSVASSEQITSYQETITSTLSGYTGSRGSTGFTLSSPVSRWNAGWTAYDPFYRPVVTNPYRTPLDVLYDYGGETRVFTVAPLQRATVDVANPGVYSFTAMTRPATGPATNVAVGSFTGGGYKPAPGQAPPKKPAKLDTVKNALVQVKFARGSSEPFTVKSLADLGKDATMNGATKVLLDGEIPAWGQWSKTPDGKALFEITETQLTPGVNPPGQDPLPGYQVKLTSAEQSASWISKHQTALIGVAAGAGVLALGAVGLILGMRRRRSAE